MTGIERALEISKELFDIANSYAGNSTGCAAVYLHQACNYILKAKEELEAVAKQQPK